MAEFKIGRLRFTWAGEWTDGQFYNRDAVAQYNGKTYVCIVPHTSNVDFYNDLNFVTPGGASTPYWTLMLDGKTWIGDWNSSTKYSLGNIVIYGGTIYECTTQHTSTSSFDPVKWTIYSQYDQWNANWSINTAYGLGDIVKYGGIVYRCTAYHVSASTISSGLENDLNKWEVVTLGIEFKNFWAQSTRYKLNDLVKNDADVYICTFGHTSTLQFDETKWELWIPGEAFLDAWISNQIYQPDDIVTYGGYSYISLTVNNTNNIPSTSTINWELVTQGYKMQNEWNSGTQYRTGDVVRKGGNLYSAIADNAGQNPTDYSATATKESPSYNWTVVEFGGQVVQGPMVGSGPGGPIYAAVLNVIGLTGDPEILNQWAVDQVLTITINDLVTHSFTVAAPLTAGQVLFNETYTDYGTVTAISFTNINDVGATLTVNSTTNLIQGLIAVAPGFTQGQTIAKIVDATTIILSDPPNAIIAPGTPLHFIGINYINWSLVTPGTAWKSFWELNTLYTVSELVIWQNGTYRCVQNHTANGFFRPDLDVENQFWVVYALHAKENAGNTQGDLVAFSGTKPVAIHIKAEIDPVDATENYLLRVTGTQPNWKKMFVIPDVYYVATNGIDDVTHGDIIDRPWASVKYATERVANGFFFQNANTLLTLNKEFLVEEMYQWMLYQKFNAISPFTFVSEFDQLATRRDAEIVIDALSHDMVRGSNSAIVTITKAYFAENSTTTFFNSATDAAQAYIVASLTYVKTIISDIFQNQAPSQNYQNLTILWNSGSTYQTGDVVYYSGKYYESLIDNNTFLLTVAESWVETTAPITIIQQYVNNGLTLESGAYLEASSLMDILISAIANATTENLPLINGGQTATIYVKTGTYFEELPIIVPEHTAIVGDELRGSTIQPKNTVYTFTTSASAATNRFTLRSIENVTVGIPVQFSANSVNDDFGGVTLGKTYYIKEIFNKQITISETIGGPVVTLTTGVGNMTVYAGDCLKDMFYMRNATGLRNLTLTGLAGSLTAINGFGTQRPTGGAYTSLDPGKGPNDTRTWIISRSPYIQNVTTFGVGCTGLKIDGKLHNGGNRSMVCNDYTQILSDGIGVWCTGSNSLTECVSVFGYYNYAAYFAEDGGRIRATNGNSSYGTYGVIAEGYDDTELPISGLVDNQSSQVQASVQSAFGTKAELISVQYANAGSNYTELTTNLLRQSNHFQKAVWINDGNVTVQQNTTSPFGDTNAWTLTGTTSGTNTSYIHQDISILPAGAEYTNLASINVTGSGNNATFDITVGSTGYSAIVNAGGTGYVTGSELRIPGSLLGGSDGVNDCFLTITSLSGSSVLGVDVSGVVPTNSNLNYTISVYAKAGTSPSFDMYAIFSGDTTSTSAISYAFDTNGFTTYHDTNGADPVSYGKLELPNGWYRIWMTVYDNVGLNNMLSVRIYPRGKAGLAGSTRLYGMQAQISSSPTFYLDTNDDQFSSYANYSVVGSGTGAQLLGNEIRSKAVFQTRITDTGTGTGGKGYLIASNNAQGGDEVSAVLAGSDINTASNYIGMRVFIQSGTGAGQYGYISSYNEGSKVASVVKESFKILNVTNTVDTTNVLTLSSTDTTDTLFANQGIQFIPTYYTTAVTTTGIDNVIVESTVGGSTNQLVVASTAKLSVNMPIRFTGATYGGVISDFTYFIKEIIDTTHITISTEQFGSIWQLNSATGAMSMTFPGYNNYLAGGTSNMEINMPIQFTGTSIGGIAVGTTYYVNEVISLTKFTISSTLVEITISTTAGATNYLTPTTNTSQLIPFNPIKFSGITFGNIVAGTTYYINKIVNSSNFTIVDSIIQTTATDTTTSSNLITVGSTAGFVVNNPIQFIGNTFGNLVNGTTYYILAINDDFTFTVSTSPGGSAVNLATAVGDVLVKTTPAAFVLTSDFGTMYGASTNARSAISQGYGSMNGTYSTSLFGNITTGTTYYVKDILTNKTFTVSSAPGGSPITLKTNSGSMNVAALGWDHINPGTLIQPALDNSSVYYVEPRLSYSKPTFGQQDSTTNTLAPGSQWTAIAYGDGTYIAMPNANAIAGKSTDGINWSAVALPNPASWTGIAYGNKRWVAISSGGPVGSPGSTVIYSSNNAEGWRSTTLPSMSTWSNIVYGDGKFVAIATGTSNAAYSSNYGSIWQSGDSLPNAMWTGLCRGADKFVAVAKGTTTGAYSLDGISWASIVLPASSDWSSVAFGNGLYVAVSSTSAKPVFSTDGINWTTSDYTTGAVDKISYGQGVFVAVSSGSGTAYTTEDGYSWTAQSVGNAGYGAMTYGYLTGSNYEGVFVTVAAQTLSSIIRAGCQTKGRAVITSGTITGISMWEPGSGYTTAPVLTIRDPNVTLSATTLVRTGNGTLGNPTFVNNGQDYNTNSTIISISGGGYADTFQTGLRLIVKNLSALPAPGDNLVIAGNDKVYKVTNASAVFGTTAPNIKANIEISPEMSVELSPNHESAVTIRQKYSQCRLTGHDFLNVGYGNYVESNYPNLPADTVLAPQDQAVEVNYGRVFYTSTDQDGNFKVGDLFGVEQATGIVTLSATQFGLTGLETLSLGGIAVGSSSVIIRQFSTDETFIANSNNVVSTQRAIKAYLTGRLSQGGSNTFTGQLIAGTVSVGGADKIRSTIPEGAPGAVVNMPTQVRFQGEFAGWDGDGMALSYFMKSWNRR